MLTPAEYRRNIRKVYRRTSPADMAQGLQWYEDAQRRACEAAPHLTAEYAAGVVAALSPMTGWSTNLDNAEKLAAVHLAGEPMPTEGYGFKRNTAKAWAILDGLHPMDALRGPKVTAFYRNIVGCPHSVTVDRWAIRIAYYDPDGPTTVSDKEYAIIADAFRTVATEVGITARQLQAATWVYYRRVHARAVFDPPKIGE
jgi:hypothetical protein